MKHHYLVLAATLAACGGADFGIQAGPDKAPIFAGGSRWVKVDLHRDDGFSQDVVVTVSDPPGVTADVITFTGDTATDALRIAIDPDLEVGELPITVVASSDGNSATATLVLDVLAAQPSSQELIAAALAAGQIDLGTSLLYRSEAVTGDTALPAELHGSGPEEDLGLASAIAAATPTLSPDSVAALHPYVVRPANGDSIYALANSSARTSQIAAPETGWSTPPPENCTGSNAWRSKRSAIIPVRVWIECEGALSDATEARAMDRMLAVLEKLWPQEVALMGPPLADAGGPDEGGDDAFDVYLVDGAIMRGGETPDIYTLIDGGMSAVAKPSPPFTTNSSGHDISSGYMIVPRIGSQGEVVRGALSHELFHILQFAHTIQTAFSGDDEYWFYEASATWAYVHFDRDWPIHIAAAEHTGRFGRYEKGGVGLQASKPVVHMYASYIWAQFLEQQTGSGSAIAAIWTDLEAATTFAEADDIIDRHMAYADNFHTFALRNLNQAFTPGDPLPADHRYHDYDEQFPDGSPTPFKNTVALQLGDAYKQTLDMPPLSTNYVRLDITGNTIKKVEIDFSSVQPQEAVDIDALIQPKDTWLADTLSFTGQGKAVFCFDRGLSTATVRGQFKAMELVISNHAHARDQQVTGQLAITASADLCSVWAGTTHSTMTKTDMSGTLVETIDTNVVLSSDPASSAMAFKLNGGNYTYRSDFNSANRTPQCRSFTDAAGPMTAGAPTDSSPGTTFANLILYPGSPQSYTGGGQSYVTANSTSDCNDANTDEMTSALGFIQWWSTAGVGPYLVKPDGSIADSADVADPVSGATIHYTWSLTKIDQ